MSSAVSLSHQAQLIRLGESQLILINLDISKDSTWLKSEQVLESATQNTETLRSLCCNNVFHSGCSSAEKLSEFSLLHNLEVFPSFPDFVLNHICVISKELSRHQPMHGIKCNFPLESQKIFSFSCTHRKKCLLCNNVLMIVAASIMGFSKISQSFEMILIGRFMCGLSAGGWLLPQVSGRFQQNFHLFSKWIISLH